MSEQLYAYKHNRNYFTIEDSDYYPESPRKCYDFNSTFITFERDYSSPDHNEFETWTDMMKHFKTEYTGNRREDLDNLQENALKQGYILMPVWKYEHGGVAYAAADGNPFPDDGWDSGVCGVIYEKRNRRNIEQVREQLVKEVEEYNNWLNEPTYEITEYDRYGEVVDSISGVYRDGYDQSDAELIASVANDYFGYDISADDLLELDNYGRASDTIRNFDEER